MAASAARKAAKLLEELRSGDRRLGSKAHAEAAHALTELAHRYPDLMVPNREGELFSIIPLAVGTYNKYMEYLGKGKEAKAAPKVLELEYKPRVITPSSKVSVEAIVRKQVKRHVKTERKKRATAEARKKASAKKQAVIEVKRAAVATPPVATPAASHGAGYSSGGVARGAPAAFASFVYRKQEPPLHKHHKSARGLSRGMASGFWKPSSGASAIQGPVVAARSVTAVAAPVAPSQRSGIEALLQRIIDHIQSQPISVSGGAAKKRGRPAGRKDSAKRAKKGEGKKKSAAPKSKPRAMKAAKVVVVEKKVVKAAMKPKKVIHKAAKKKSKSSGLSRELAELSRLTPKALRMTPQTSKAGKEHRHRKVEKGKKRYK